MLHEVMLNYEKAILKFPGPADVLRNYNSFTSYFRVRTTWEYADCKPGQKVLLVGDGGGKDYWYFAYHGIYCDVVDVAEQSLIPYVLIWDISSSELPFNSETFDAVIMCDVLEHIYNDVKALANIHAMLKNSGYLVLSGPYWHDIPDHHVRIHSPKIIVRMLHHNGFRVEKITSRGFIVNLYRTIHPFILFIHYLIFLTTGNVNMIHFNKILYNAIKGIQAKEIIPYLDRMIFGNRGGLNGYVLRACKNLDMPYDVASLNRNIFTNMGVRRKNQSYHNV